MASLLMLNLPREEGQELCLTCMLPLLKLSGTLRLFESQEILGEWWGTNNHKMPMECSE